MGIAVMQHDCARDGHCDHFSHVNYEGNCDIKVYVCCWCGRQREEKSFHHFFTKSSWGTEEKDKHGIFKPTVVSTFIYP